MTSQGMIDDLSAAFPQASIGTQWQLLSDAVMGGISTGGMERAEIDHRNAIRMQGNVSLENNGGFIQMALDLAGNGATCNAAAFAGIAIDAFGNGEEYGLHLRTSGLARPWQSYRMTFVAEPRWQAFTFPFSGFVAHRTDQPLDVRALRRLGIVAIGRAFAADVAIGGVRFYMP